jgi:hypothetical protein
LVLRVRVERVHPARAWTQHLEQGQSGVPIPLTDSTLRVLEVYKGTPGEFVTVSQRGGHLDATDQYPSVDEPPTSRISACA